MASDETNKSNAYYRGQTFNDIGNAIKSGEYGTKVKFIDTTDWDINFSEEESIHPSVSGHDQIKAKLIAWLDANNLK